MKHRYAFTTMLLMVVWSVFALVDESTTRSGDAVVMATPRQPLPEIAITLGPIEDTWIDELNPNANYDTEVTLTLSKDEFERERRALLKFDLSRIPADAVVSWATLRLYQRDGFPAEQDWVVNVAKVTQPWSAISVTWNNRPESVCCVDSVMTQAIAGQSYSWNVTELVRAWLATPADHPNYGLELNGGPADYYRGREYDSREGIVQPQLIVVYVPPTPVPTPTRTPTTVPDSLHFVDSGGSPIVGERLRVLCYAENASTTVPTELAVDTGPSGIPITPLPPECKWLAALRLRHVQPSNKPDHGPAYWAYAASWQPNTTTLIEAKGAVAIRDEWPLVLFNIVASLEWEPHAGSDYVERLWEGLGYASMYLADLTDGLMAFGPITIYTGGRNWNGADLRFHAANDLRPAAFVGGIVADPIEYTVGATQPTFRPAAAFFGRYWNGDDAYEGDWNRQEGFRTIVHEWAHYALFLYDEYQKSDGSTTYCVCTELRKLEDGPEVCGGESTGDTAFTPSNAASAMAYHYTASELWHPIHGTPEACVDTDQWRVHRRPAVSPARRGGTDWEVLELWYQIQGLHGTPGLVPFLVPDTPRSEPSIPFIPDRDGTSSLPSLSDVLAPWGPVGALFGRPPDADFRLYLPGVTDSRDGATVSEVDVEINLSESLVFSQTLVSHIYVVPGAASADSHPIIYQGTIHGLSDTAESGHFSLFGVRESDEMWVTIDQYAPHPSVNRRYKYFGPLPPGSPIIASVDNWQSSLDLVYTMETPHGEVGKVTKMKVYLHSPEPHDTPPEAVLCVPDISDGCRNEMMWPAGSGDIWKDKWVATFEFNKAEPSPDSWENKPFPLYGVIHIRANGVGELIRWFRDGGGAGPGHMFADTPLREGVVMVDSEGLPEPGPCNRIMVMPAADYRALESLIKDYELVGTPMDIDILFGEGKCSNRVPGDEGIPASLGGLRLTFFYNEEAVERLGIDDETQLRILHFSRSSGQWNEIAFNHQINTDLNWVATTIVEDGIYAIGRCRTWAQDGNCRQLLAP